MISKKRLFRVWIYFSLVIALFLLGTLPKSIWARHHQMLSTKELVDKSDIVLIGKIVKSTRVDHTWPDEFRGYALFESSFQKIAVLKGNVDDEFIRLHHVRWDSSVIEKPVNISLTSFPKFYADKMDDLKPSQFILFDSEIAFLVFAKHDDSGTYIPVTCPEDECDSMHRMVGGLGW